ncbi:hypothetical protein [Campylobacter sp.]|uniref:hypothetical protein n=1 Tax=Campylobacter sp. TaxID=205 RepID=UPI0025BE63C7|nr:hypothetical protein [Campylobacter sp.]
MNEPYIVKISDSDAMMFGCEADERVREFVAKFDGWEYESEFERTSYLLGTDVFIEVASEERLNEGALRAQISNEKALDADGGAAYLLLSPRHIAAEELRGAFEGRAPQEFARIIEGLEAKYDCKDRILCYIVCYFTPKGKEGMRADFGVQI